MLICISVCLFLSVCQLHVEGLYSELGMLEIVSPVFSKEMRLVGMNHQDNFWFINLLREIFNYKSVLNVG